MAVVMIVTEVAVVLYILIPHLNLFFKSVVTLTNVSAQDGPVLNISMMHSGR